MKKSFLLLLSLIYSTLTLAQNFWQQTNGPYAPGYVTAINAGTNENVYVALDKAGLYRSVDTGKSFSYLSGTLTNTSIGAILVTQQGHIFVGDASYQSLKGVLRSTDDGNTWTQVLPSQYIQTISSDSDGYIFAGTRESGIFRSSDGGSTWTQLDLNSTVRIVSSVASSPAGYLFASGWRTDWFSGTRTLRSSDKGETWDSLDVPAGIIILDFAFAQGDYIVATFGVSTPGDSAGLLFSSDNGTTWIRQNIVQNYFFGSLPLIFDISSNSFFACFYNKILRSTDFGNSWSVVSIMGGIRCLESNQEGFLFVGTSNGLKRSSAMGYTWTEADSGFFARYPNHLTLFPANKIYTNTNNYSVFRLAEDRMNWIKDPAAHAGSFLINNTGNFFLSDWEIHKSTDFGNTWTTVFSQQQNGDNTTEITNLSNGYILSAGVVYGWIQETTSYIWRSTDDGNSWDWVYANGNINPWDNMSLNTLATLSNDIILAGGGINGVIRSTDLGTTWSSSMNGLPIDINCSVIRVKQDGLIFLGSVSNGMYRSSDEGLNWVAINNGLTSLDIRTIAINSYGTIYIGTAAGIFGSADDGNYWVSLNNGLFDHSVWSLLCDSLDYLFAATNATGIYRSVEPTTSIEKNPANNIAFFQLRQNYPNPFNPTTTISFSIPQTENVELKIYDILGNEVATLVNEEKPVGEYEVEFDGSKLSSGIYFYQLEAGSFIQTKKLVLLK